MRRPRVAFPRAAVLRQSESRPAQSQQVPAFELARLRALLRWSLVLKLFLLAQELVLPSKFERHW